MWYNEAGENTDVFLSSKVAIVRNIRGYAFPIKMSAEDMETVCDKAKDFADKMGMNYLSAEDLSNKQKLAFLKHDIISIEFAKEVAGKGLMINGDESLSIVVNQFNHFKAQAMCNGSNIEKVFTDVERLAVELEKEFDVAYSEKYGFLTSRPFYVGTGLRISFIVSIPGVEKSGILPKLLGRLNSLDWKMIPYVGEVNSKKTGNLYEIFNTSTLGITEEKIYERAQIVISDILKVERMCRDAIYSKKKIIVEDQYYRAYGMLKYCRKLELSEALEALGWLRLGHSLIEDSDIGIDLIKINDMTARICTEIKNSQGSDTLKNGEARAKQIQSIMEGDDD